MFAGAFVVHFHLVTCVIVVSCSNGTINSDLDDDLWQSLEDQTNHWPTEMKLTTKNYQNPTNQHDPSEDPMGGIEPSLGDNLAPFLMPVYVIPTEKLYVGSLVNNKAVLTSCSSTLVAVKQDAFLYVKAEQLLVAVYLTIHGKITPVMTGVMEIRRHPTCDQPYPGGSWKNDVALLLLPIAIASTPNVIEPIELPSLDFFEIYSAIKEKVWNNTTCHAVIMKYRGEEFPRSKTLLPVKIRKSSGCQRTCGYMMDQCTRELGGYSVHLLDGNAFDRRDASHGAAIVCDGRIYGVLMPDYTCGHDSLGHLPKPEAMLYMYVNFADPGVKPKPIVGSNGSDRNGSNVAVYSIMTSWLIAFSSGSVLPVIYGFITAVTFIGDDDN